MKLKIYTWNTHKRLKRKSSKNQNFFIYTSTEITLKGSFQTIFYLN